MLKKKLALYKEQLPQEKVYLHIDKPFYKPGDAIWFQAYLLKGEDHKPSQLSNVVYVELVNPKGNVEASRSLASMNGKAKGDFQLDPTAPGGIYKIRAYTQWMKNFGEETFFSKELQVQKIITPKLLLSLDFEREGYGPADRVTATLKARDLENNPITAQKIDYKVSLAGQQFLVQKAFTNEKGEASIAFQLPADLKSADGLLNVVVESRGVAESVSRAIPITLNKVALQFFPEGGELVENVAGKVAFKALNEFGKAADVEGVILDEKGNQVQQFSSFHKGMGAFDFTPEAGRTYTAKLTKPASADSVYHLPAALKNGYSLRLEQKDAKTLTATIYNPLKNPVYLLGQLRGEIYFNREIKAGAGTTKLDISLENFPVGVAQFTLFDHQQLEQCERLVFVNKERRLHIDLETDKEQYQVREKVSLKIRTYDENKIPVPASLSLSVVDDKIISYADDKQDNILSHLLLSSDLKGKIEEPSFYFNPDEAKATAALDYLLMTQGWRRFTWQQVLQGAGGISYYPEKLNSVSGRVLNRRTGAPIEASVTLVELENRRRAVQLNTKPDGSFLFLNTDPASALQLFARAKGLKKENLQLVLDSEIASNYNTISETGGEIEVYTLFEVTDLSIEEEAGFAEIESMDFAAPVENIVLTEDMKSLEEVVVVGYGE